MRNYPTIFVTIVISANALPAMAQGGFNGSGTPAAAITLPVASDEVCSRSCFGSNDNTAATLTITASANWFGNGGSISASASCSRSRRFTSAPYASQCINGAFYLRENTTYTCAADYACLVTLTGTANAGFVFAGWNVSGGVQLSKNITYTANETLTETYANPEKFVGYKNSEECFAYGEASTACWDMIGSKQTEALTRLWNRVKIAYAPTFIRSALPGSGSTSPGSSSGGPSTLPIAQPPSFGPGGGGGKGPAQPPRLPSIGDPGEGGRPVAPRWSPCFPGSVMIATPKGFSEIRNLRSGDIVTGWDIVAMRPVEVRITETQKTPNMRVRNLSLSDGKTKRNLHVTSNHNVFVMRDGKIQSVAVGSMKPGERVMLRPDGKSRLVTFKLEEIRDNPEAEDVYNIVIAGAAGYFADGVLVESMPNTRDVSMAK